MTFKFTPIRIIKSISKKGMIFQIRLPIIGQDKWVAIRMQNIWKNSDLADNRAKMEYIPIPKQEIDLQTLFNLKKRTVNTVAGQLK